MKKLALLAALAAAVGLAGTAIAAFPQDNVKLYTGCLTPGGTLVNVAEGDNPTQACASPKQVVKLSGGDITSLTVTAPLTGGGTNGALTIGLDASATLPTCSASNAVPKWNLSTSRWACGTDNDTTYSAGTGLALSGTQFSIGADYRVKNTPDCDVGKFATGFDSDGTIQCSTPAASSLDSFIKLAVDVGIPDDNQRREVIGDNLPPGKYFIIIQGTVHSEKNMDSGTSMDCGARRFDSETLNEVADVPFSFAGPQTVTADNPRVRLECSAEQNADGLSVRDLAMTGIKIG